VWDLTSGQERSRHNHPRPITALCLTPNAERVIAGDEEGLSVYAPESVDGQATARLTTTAAVTALAANPILSGFAVLGTQMPVISGACSGRDRRATQVVGQARPAGGWAATPSNPADALPVRGIRAAP
jgi:hypothetical protein